MANTNTFAINYTERKLLIVLNGDTHTFDLNDGDVGDFWDGFVTADGKEWDINFHQEDATCEPVVAVYPAVWVGDENGSYDIDTNNEILLDCIAQRGGAEEYFGEQVLPPMHYATNELSSREMKQTIAIIIAKIEACGIGAWNADLENTIEAVACEDYYGDIESKEPTVKYNGWFEDLQKLKEIL